ncbi:MAG TPA: DNA-formamidopyrimidine glycosylase family protein [Solirubrobacteraceae bacterium]|nr:DNA-formamidopyrimidine glycosylase family protein [Solirubrobacteraceae bacterium]
MPELPEVERARALIAERALHRRIVAVDDTDTYVCRPHAPGEIAAALVGRELVAAHRQGKSMWCETSGGGPALGLHLGMTGRIVIDEHQAGDPPPAVEARRADRFTVRFADGGSLVLRDRRRLGRARLEPVIDRLGPDAAEVSRAEFRERVGRGRTAIKARIMDQAVIAGVGNLLADEALWKAGIDPRRPAGELTLDELDRLRVAVRAATRSAIRKGGVHTGALIPHRSREGACPRCGTALSRTTIGGRTTWWCPVDQA